MSNLSLELLVAQRVEVGLWKDSNWSIKKWSILVSKVYLLVSD